MIHSDEIRTILDLLPDIRDGRVYDRVHHLLRDIVIKLEEQEMLQTRLDEAFKRMRASLEDL